MSVVHYDIDGFVKAHKTALCSVFDVAPERVEVCAPVRWEGFPDPHPVLTIDIRIDGQRAPAKWWELTQTMIDVAEARVRLDKQRADIERRVAALPWWHRWILRARMWWRR